MAGLLAHLFSPFEIGQEGEPAAVVEMDSYGYAVRYGHHNLDPPPSYIYSEHCMAVMNKCRLYMERPPGGRYSSVADSLNANLSIDTEKMWRTEKAILSTVTLHAILFRPNLHDLFVAFADSVVNAYERPRVHWTWDELFPP